MLRTARNFGGPLARDWSLICRDESRTIQSTKEDADINIIVGRFLKTGLLPEVTAPPSYQAFAGVFDFQSAMNVIALAKSSFMSLDADVRRRFGNDPAEFVNFVEARDADGNRSNLEELRKLKIVLPEAVKVDPPVMRVEVVNAKPEGGESVNKK